MKTVVIGILILFTVNVIYGQKVRDVYRIYNYQQSCLLSVSNNEFVNIAYSDYGECNSLTQSFDIRYLYQSHEYDQELNLYLFPYRFYSSKRVRFISPDPKSQYHSPYLFVGADPINMVDRDGKEGKPLILFQEDHRYPKGLDSQILDFKEAVPDAHYLPLSDFVMDRIGNLEDWNGNVFIKAHMGPDVGREMYSERLSDRFVYKTRVKYAKPIHGDGEFYVSVDAKEIGRKLRMLSEDTRVPINNIVAGGCEGTTAAKGIATGFSEAGLNLGKHNLNVYGLKDHRNAAFYGKKTISQLGHGELEQPRFQITPEGYKLYPKVEVSPKGEKKFKNFEVDVKGRGRTPLRYVEGADFYKDFANARIPDSIRPNYDVFKVAY